MVAIELGKGGLGPAAEVMPEVRAGPGAVAATASVVPLRAQARAHPPGPGIGIVDVDLAVAVALRAVERDVLVDDLRLGLERPLSAQGDRQAGLQRCSGPPA